MSVARLNSWHRGLAMVIALPVLLWMSSGLLHPAMAWLMVPPLESRQLALAPLPAADAVLAPAELLAAEQVSELQSLRLQQIDGRWYYRLQLPQQPALYLDAITGQRRADGERKHALWLARELAGLPDLPVLTVEPVSEFTAHYREINRLLPVWRVRFDRPDGLAVYVDTEEQRFASADTGARRLALDTFALLHNLSFLGADDSVLRRSVVSVLAAAVLLMALTGLALLLLRLRRLQQGHGARRWHRMLGLLVGLSLLGFASSGLHTALNKWQQSDWSSFRDRALLAATPLSANPLLAADGAVAMRPLRIADGYYWQYQYVDAEQGISLQYRDAQTLELLAEGDLRYATELADRYLAEPLVVADAVALADFRFDYPSVYKRLPVIRLGLEDSPVTALFVETRSGALGNEATAQSRLQGLHFMNLHKYHFLGKLGLSPPQRDLLMSVLVLLIFALWLAGMRLLWRRYRRR